MKKVFWRTDSSKSLWNYSGNPESVVIGLCYFLPIDFICHKTLNPEWLIYLENTCPILGKTAEILLKKAEYLRNGTKS